MKVRAFVLVLAGALGGVLLATLLTTIAMPGVAAMQRTSATAAANAKKPYVRLTTPRVKAIEPEDFTPEQRAAVGPTGRANLNFRTALYEPELGKRWWSWLTFVWNPVPRGDSALKLYDKELVVLRVNWLCNDDWVWGQHVPIAKRNGRTDADIERIPKGPDAAGWNENDAALLRAVEELHTDYFISDETWNRLSKIYNVRQMLDLIFTVGNYHLNAMYTNSVGMPFEKGFSGLPKAE
jgi:alkylhydroperoxidase family enzyme